MLRNPAIIQSLEGINFVMVVNECALAKSLPEQSIVDKSYASDVECYGTEEERLELINLIHMEGLIVGRVIDVDKTGEIKTSN